MQVINQGRVNFEYRRAEYEPIITESILSNRVLTRVVTSTLKVEKQVDKVAASAFDILNYKITIINTSNKYVENVIFKDFIPRGTGFICNSIKVNNIKKRCITTEQGLNLGDFKLGESLSVKFKVVILPGYKYKQINNYAIISYDFTHNIEEKPIRIVIKSNYVDTVIKNKLFKQFEIQSMVKFQYNYLEHININRILTKVNILQTKIVNGVKDNKVVIIGEIIYDIICKEYLCKYSNKNFNIRHTEGFSNFIVVPQGIKYCKVSNIKVDIEESTFYKLDNKLLVTNIQLLLSLNE